MKKTSQPQGEIDQLMQEVDALTRPSPRLRGASVAVKHLDDPQRQLRWAVFWSEYPATSKKRRPTRRAKFFATRTEADALRARLLPLLQRKAQQERRLRSGIAS